MRIALLGISDETLPLARAILARPDLPLAWASELGEHRTEIARLAPLTTLDEPWETLLGGTSADLVIVSRGPDEELRAEQLRKLIAAGVPLVVEHPIHSSMLIAYELEMIRKEVGSLLVPYDATLYSDAFRLLEQVALSEKSSIGAIEQVIVDQRRQNRSPQRVRELFARDALLLRMLCGDLTRLSAMAPTAAADPYANLGIQLSGPSGALVRWSIGPRDELTGERFTMIGAIGRATLTMPEQGNWRLEVRSERGDTAQEFAHPQVASDELNRLTHALNRGELEPDWSDASRAIELSDSIDRSLKKSRTVDLYNEDFTEQGTFKGTMTSLGCGLLLISLGVLVVGVAGVTMGIKWATYWPQALFLVLIAFLGLQLLKLVFPDQPVGGSPSENAVTERSDRVGSSDR
jgi:predicted dehydrogenase